MWSSATGTAAYEKCHLRRPKVIRSGGSTNERSEASPLVRRHAHHFRSQLKACCVHKIKSHGMLIMLTHVALLLAQLLLNLTTALSSADGNLAVIGTRNDSAPTILLSSSSKDPMIQCIGMMRGILKTAGSHLEPLVEAVGRCPSSSSKEEAALCATDIHAFPPEAGSTDELQVSFLAMLRSNQLHKISSHLRLAIRKVSPVVHTDSGVIYANIYCAQCHNATANKGINRLPRKLFCDNVKGTTQCFVSAEPPETVKYCDVENPTPRFYFSWDSIFDLPDDFEAEDDDAEGTSGMRLVYDVFQWVLCTFSVLSLVLAIAVFASSQRLHRPLPGKMMIALCVALLGALLSFIFGSGVIDAIQKPVRSMCIVFAWLLQLFLLSAFVWMALFALELFRTFGINRMFKQFFLCRRCRKNHERKHNATSMMLRSRGSDSNNKARFKYQIITAVLTPLCFALPALVINEYNYDRLEAIYRVTQNTTWPASTQEEVLDPTLYRLNPGFCPVQDPNYAWFKGHYIALLVWFFIPSGLLICFNLIALIVVSVHICRLKQETGLSSSAESSRNVADKRGSRYLVAVCAKLAIILGASWFIQILAALLKMELLGRLAGLANCAQGGILAISMLVGSKARRVMLRWLPARCREALGVGGSTLRSTMEMNSSSKYRSQLAPPHSSQITILLHSNSS